MKNLVLMPGYFVIEQKLKKSSDLILPGQVNPAEQQKASYTVESDRIVDFIDVNGEKSQTVINGTPILQKWAVEKGPEFSYIVSGKFGDNEVVQKLVFNNSALIGVLSEDK